MVQKPQLNFQAVLDELDAPAPATAEPGPFPLSDLKLDLVARMEDIEADWRRLQDLPHNSLHQAYDWCHAWIATHTLPTLIVRGRIKDRTVMILPLETMRENGITIAKFIGVRYSNINSGLLDHDFRYLDGEAVQTIASQLATLLKGRADLLRMEIIPSLWRDVAHPLTGLRAAEHVNHTFQLILLDSFEQTISQLNAKRRRKKFRLQERRLQERGGYEHFEPSTAAEKHALMDLFFAQKAARFRSLGLPDAFRAPETKAFFHALLDTPPQGLDTPLELHAIRLKGEDEGRCAAIAGLSRKGDHVICQFGSIDETLAPEASPGELLFWLMIEQACKSHARVFDFGLGDQVYKRSWCTQETVAYDMFVPVSPKGWLTMHLLIGAMRAKAAVKRNRTLYAWLQKLRAGRQAQNTPAVESE